MKRSEMIEILANEFVNRGMTSDKMSILAASEILDRLEKAGMLPPAKYKDSGNNVCHLCKWELEEELDET
jgi:hypothetical protein